MNAYKKLELKKLTMQVTKNNHVYINLAQSLTGLIGFLYILVFTLPISCRTVYIIESVPQAVEVPNDGNFVQIDLNNLKCHQPQQYNNQENISLYNTTPNMVYQPSGIQNPQLYYESQVQPIPIINTNQNPQQMVDISKDRIVGEVKIDQKPETYTTDKLAIAKTSDNKTGKKSSTSKNDTESKNSIRSNNTKSTKAKCANSLINSGMFILLQLLTDCSV